MEITEEVLQLAPFNWDEHEHRKLLMEMLCEGLNNRQICERLREQHQLCLNSQGVTRWRERWANKIAVHESKALQQARLTGWGKRLVRVQKIQELIEQAYEELRSLSPARWKNLPDKLIALVRELRTELGQDEPTQLQMGGDFHVHHDFAQLSDEDALALLVATRQHTPRIVEGSSTGLRHLEPALPAADCAGERPTSDISAA